MGQIMGKILPWLRTVGADRSGAVSIEYSLIATLVSIVIISAVAFIGTSVENLFNSVANALN